MAGFREAIKQAMKEQAEPAEVENEEEVQTSAPDPAEPVEAAAEVVEEPAEEKPPAPKTAAERARDEKTGKFVEKPKEPRGAKAAIVQLKAKASAKPAATESAPEEGAPAKAVVPPVPGDKAPAAAAPASGADPGLRAPQSWKPAAREKFAALPPEVKQEVLRREKETAAALQETAEPRRFVESFRQVAQPYAQLINEVAGGDPIRAFHGLLTTVHNLRTGGPDQKAAILAKMIRGYGVDPELLEKAYLGTPGDAAPAQQPQQFRDPRFDQFLEQQKQAVVARKAKEWEDFVTANEFALDVKDDMHDLIAGAARRGVALSYKDAYDRAVRINPDTAAVLKQREEAEQAKAKQASTQRARAAGATPKSSPAPSAPAGGQPKDRRDAIREAVKALRGQ